jgi:hypothetical protein
MRDFAILKLNDGAKSVVVFRACREDSPMNLILNDDDMTSVRCMDNQIICGAQFDDVDVTPEPIHQVGSSPNDARPAEIVENFVNRVVGDDVKEVFAIDPVTQRLSNHMEVRVGGLIGSIFRSSQSEFSVLFMAFNETTIKGEATIEQEGTSRLVANTEVSHEEARQD